MGECDGDGPWKSSSHGSELAFVKYWARSPVESETEKEMVGV